MSWVLTASGSLAGPDELMSRFLAGRVQSERRPLERAEVVDAESGADLRLTARSGGALRASLAWMDLEVSKTVQANGDFHVRIAAHRDLLVLVRTGNRLRVTRGDQSAALSLDRADEDGLDRVQMVLAGSHAVRTFRGLHRQLSPDSRDSAPGVSFDNLDILLGLLHGEPGVVDRRAPVAREAGGRLSRIVCGDEPSCYSEYEAEVIRAWDDFAQCVDDVKWYPLLQEACAFTWLLKVESAWFRFIGCSSIPLKAT
jgi:hypothetical protein